MKAILSKHRPKDCDKQKWEETWKNSAYVLTPLVNVLAELRGKDTITEEDLQHNNLHDLLIWNASKRRIIDQIIDIIDITIDNSK